MDFPKTKPHIDSGQTAIIICTKNGGLFIEDQLESIKNQTYSEFDIYISENNSSDDTLEKIYKFKKNNPDINCIVSNGDDGFFSNNFINLIKSINKDYKYYAFCDQDDIWLDFHLNRGINHLKKYDVNAPCLVCSSTILINVKGRHIGNSKIFSKSPSFQNALVQSIAGGNTMVFNKGAFNLLKNLNINNNNVPSHDWMLYILVTAYGGKVVYEKNPSVCYRQHSSNIIGSNAGFIAFCKRVKLALEGSWKKWTKVNLSLLLKQKDLPIQSKNIINDFYLLHSSKNIFKKLFLLKKLGLYRQSFLGNINLVLAVLINKI